MSGSGFRRAVLGTLILVLIAIWVRNLFLLMPEVEVAARATTSVDSLLNTDASGHGLADSTFTIDPGLRSPFAAAKLEQPRPARKLESSRAKPPIESIRSSLIGCVYSAQQPHIVVLDSATDRTVVLRAGDTLNGFVVTRIARSEVNWKSLKGRRLVWHSPN